MLQVKIVPVTAFAQNCSIVWDAESKEAILIDAGGEPDKLQAEVEALGLTVKALWLTHGHLDHAGAVGALKKRWNVPEYRHSVPRPPAEKSRHFVWPVLPGFPDSRQKMPDS